MIEVVLAVGLVLSPAVITWLWMRNSQAQVDHQKFLSEQNQMLTAALMATKNSPYAASSAAYVAMPGDLAEHHLGEVPIDEEPIIPEGSFLLGTEPVDLET